MKLWHSLYGIATVLSWLSTAVCMRQTQIDELRRTSAEMFYHGYNNYMQHAFPEDELRPLTCQPLTRNRSEPWNFGLNDVLGNYSLTLIDSLSTLAILASAPDDGSAISGPTSLANFHSAIIEIVRHYGDGTSGDSGQGIRARGFDLDSKVQVFETVIRGVGGLLSGHLFAVGELPIRGYEPYGDRDWETENPFVTEGIKWAENFTYDGQLLRLAYDLTERLLPAFYTTSGIPYPRVNLRTGIPFYPNSPLHRLMGKEYLNSMDSREITETCSAGAASLVLEFTVLSRLTGDDRFEQIAKRAFWAIWSRKSPIDLIGNGIDAEHGRWLSHIAGIGAGVDSFFEYALKTHILLSGQNSKSFRVSKPPKFRDSPRQWLDPNELHVKNPLSNASNSPEAFLAVWHQAHSAVKRHLYNNYQHPGHDFHHPSYINANLDSGALAAYWIDSLSAFYPGLLVLAGEVEEAIESNLLYTALWSRFSALPERWSLRDGNVEYNIDWWPGRPELIESNYHLYRATKDPWYLRVGEMVIKDIVKNCYVNCGWAGLKDVRTLEKSDRMESFFLGETTKYLYLLYDNGHPLNKLDAAYVFTTEGHPLVLPKKGSRRPRPTSTVHHVDPLLMIREQYSDEWNAIYECPAPSRPSTLTGSITAERSDIYHAAMQAGLQHTRMQPGRHKRIKDSAGRTITTLIPGNEFFPWTLPPSMVPVNGTTKRLPDWRMSTLEFPTTKEGSALEELFPTLNVERIPGSGIRVHTTDKLKLQLAQEPATIFQEAEWRVMAVNGIPLGRDETVQMLLHQIAEYNVPLFNVVRDSEYMDVTFHFERDADGTHSARAIISAYRAAVNNIRSQLPSVLHTNPSDPAAAGNTRQNRDLPHRFTETFEAATSSGPGSVTKSLLVAKKLPVMDTIYLADLGCDAPLPVLAPQNHEVIVFKRGGCTFQQKIANIPEVPRTSESLKMVIMVDDDGGDVVRPQLFYKQKGPEGRDREWQVPAVLVTGKGLYGRLGGVWRVTLAKRYYVESRGLRIRNLVVLQ